MLQVQHRLFAHVDFKALFTLRRVALVLVFHQADKIAHFALERYVRHQAVTGFSIQARHVAGIRIAIGVAVFHVEDENKVVAVCEWMGGGHADAPSVLVESSGFLLKKSCRWW